MRQHSVIRGITENEVATHGRYWETGANIMLENIRPARVKIIGKTTPPHGLADIECGATPGHGVNNKASGRGKNNVMRER